MSRFEHEDLEAMNLANRVRRQEEPDKDCGTDRIAEINKKRCEAARQKLWLILKIFICLLVASLFISVILDPEQVPVVANLGVLSCGCVIVVNVDRYFRRK